MQVTVFTGLMPDYDFSQIPGLGRSNKTYPLRQVRSNPVFSPRGLVFLGLSGLGIGPTNWLPKSLRGREILVDLTGPDPS
jgi:hypothetical protein